MKIVRLGSTETQLLYFYYVRNILNLELDYSSLISQKSLINWLYTTSGFYDSNINGNYFNFDAEVDKILLSDTYKNYMETIIKIIINSDFAAFPMFHNSYFQMCIYKDNFIEYLQHKGCKIDLHWNPVPQFYSMIENKNVLLINTLADLMKSQYDTGNLHKIYTDFPKVNNIFTCVNDYTFCNKGNDKNILDTTERICNDIKNKNIAFDCAVIGCGAYSCLFAEYINDTLKKDVIILGSLIQLYFGLKYKRYTQSNAILDETYWLDIPEIYRPENYEKVEDGCYW